jgi:hypothetical protein
LAKQRRGEVRKELAKKATAVATWLEDPYRSTKQQLFTKTTRAATAYQKNIT